MPGKVEKTGSFLMSANLRLVMPDTENRTVRQPRKRNAEVRPREYLTEAEVDRLMEAAGDNRNGHRDRTMIQVAFRHGLRVSELIGLRWDNVDLDAGTMHVTRAKNGTPSVQQIIGDELRALRRLRRESPKSPFVFVSERGAPFTADGVRKLVTRLGVAAGFEFPVHPHQLRHACGYELANRGTDTRSIQGFLGHRNIQHTVRYTELSPTRFKNIWGK